MASRKRTRAQASAAGEPHAADAPPVHLDEFCRGLYPILREGDPAAFRRYLARWEDVIGDTADLAETPPAQQRQTMAALLRHPQRFNLPPWPHVPTEVRRAATTAAATGVSWPGRAAPPGWNGAAGVPDLLPAGVAETPADTAGAAVAAEADAPARAPALTTRAAGAAHQAWTGDAAQPEAVPVGLRPGSYQVDMLTGELLPVGALPAIAEAGAGYDAGHEGTAAVDPRHRRPRRRKRAAANLVQLGLWPRVGQGTTNG